MELFPIAGGAYATVPRPPTAVGGDGISHKRSWPMSRAERAAADNCAVRAARWPKGDVRANARISPASPASDFGQRQGYTKPRRCFQHILSLPDKPILALQPLNFNRAVW